MRPAATWSRRNSDRSCGRSAYRSCPRRPCPSVRRTAPEPGTHGHRRSYLRKSRQADARRCRLCPSWSLNGVTGQEEKTIEAISNANEWTGDRIVALRAVPSGRSLHTSPPGCGVSLLGIIVISVAVAVILLVQRHRDRGGRRGHRRARRHQHSSRPAGPARAKAGTAVRLKGGRTGVTETRQPVDGELAPGPDLDARRLVR